MKYSKVGNVALKDRSCLTGRRTSSPSKRSVFRVRTGGRAPVTLGQPSSMPPPPLHCMYLGELYRTVER